MPVFAILLGAFEKNIKRACAVSFLHLGAETMHDALLFTRQELVISQGLLSCIYFLLVAVTFDVVVTLLLECGEEPGEEKTAREDGCSSKEDG